MTIADLAAKAVARIDDKTMRALGLDRDEAVAYLAAVNSYVPLDLERMAADGDVFSLVHDLAGIERHWDWLEHRFRDCFSPRYAKREAGHAAR